MNYSISAIYFINFSFRPPGLFLTVSKVKSLITSLSTLFRFFVPFCFLFFSSSFLSFFFLFFSFFFSFSFCRGLKIFSCHKFPHDFPKHFVQRFFFFDPSREETSLRPLFVLFCPAAPLLRNRTDFFFAGLYFPYDFFITFRLKKNLTFVSSFLSFSTRDRATLLEPFPLPRTITCGPIWITILGHLAVHMTVVPTSSRCAWSLDLSSKLDGNFGSQRSAKP